MAHRPTKQQMDSVFICALLFITLGVVTAGTATYALLTKPDIWSVCGGFFLMLAGFKFWDLGMDLYFEYRGQTSR